MLRINDYWKEGRYVDLWSVNHVLSGVVLASLLFYFGWQFPISLTIALILFVGWEVVEALMGIKEHATNMAMDIVCDTFGFLIVAYFHFKTSMAVHGTFLIASIILFAVFELWGFLAYEKRHRLSA